MDLSKYCIPVSRICRGMNLPKCSLVFYLQKEYPVSPGDKAYTLTCVLAPDHPVQSCWPMAEEWAGTDGYLLSAPWFVLLAQTNGVAASLTCCASFPFLAAEPPCKHPAGPSPAPAPAALPLRVPGTTHTPFAGHFPVSRLQVSHNHLSQPIPAFYFAVEKRRGWVVDAKSWYSALETASWLCLRRRRAEPSAAESCEDWPHHQGRFPLDCFGLWMCAGLQGLFSSQWHY